MTMRRGVRRITEAALIRGVAEVLGRFGTLEEGLTAVLPLVSRFVGSDHGVFVVSPAAGRRLVIGDGRPPGVDDTALARDASRFREATPVGDEFVVLMAETDAARAAILGERIRASIKREIVGSPPCEFSLTASFGIADCDASASKEREEMPVRADEALCRAKNDGRDRVRAAPKSPEPLPAGKPREPRSDPSRRIRRSHVRGRGPTIRSRRVPDRMKPPASPAYRIH